jgi:hypothetical protein
LTPILYNRSATQFQKEKVFLRIKAMKSSTLPRSKKRNPLPKPVSSNGTIQPLKQPDLKTLSPLQRQRLDTAVMLLVNHLVSSSSSR